MAKLITLHNKAEGTPFKVNPDFIAAVMDLPKKDTSEMVTKVFIRGIDYWFVVTESGEDIAAIIEAVNGK